MTIMETEAMFFNNGDVREEFATDDFVRNHLVPSFHMDVDCYKGYMVLVRLGIKEHPKPIWLVKALSLPNFVPTSPIFC